jgi:hypothetical protein
MLVRLADAWTDSFGVQHGAGELVDIDPVTLAELEEQGVVETMNFINPTSNPDVEPDDAEDQPKVAPDNFINPTGVEPDAKPDNFINPTGTDPDGADD